MKRKLKARSQTRPVRRKISNLIALWRQVYTNRKMILATLSFALVVTTWGIGYLGELTEQGLHQSKKILARVGFSVREILVEGREHTDPTVILTSLGVSRGESIFNLKPEEAQKQLEGLSWVYSAMVQRRLPDTVYIRLVERQPIAIWQSNAKLHLIDAKGAVIDKFDASEFGHLIVLTGKDANKHAHQFLNMLSDYPELQKRIKGASFVSGRRWDLILDNKVRVKLPEKNTQEALAKLLKMHEEHQLAAGHVNTIDLRLPDRSFLYVQDTEHDKKNKGNLT